MDRWGPRANVQLSTFNVQRVQNEVDNAISVRIDKWLWAVRLFKTRSQATAACAAGKVRIADQPVKPARATRVGEVITAKVAGITRTVKVVELLENRVGAKLVPNYLEDLTPPSEYEKRPEPPPHKDFGFRRQRRRDFPSL